MQWSHLLKRLIAYFGGHPGQVLVLDRALQLDRTRRREQTLKSVGWDLATRAFLEKGAKLQMSAMLMGLTWVNRHEPGLAAAVFFTAQVLLLMGLIVWDLFQGLMDDSVWQTIGSWPISSRTYLMARLLVPLRAALKLSILLVLPSALLVGFFGASVMAVILFLLCGLLVAPAVVFSSTGVLVMLIHVVGIRRLRSGLVLLLATAMGISTILRVHLLRLITEPNPVWDVLPTGWLARLVEAGNSGSLFSLGAGLAGFVAWLIGPFLIFQAAARSYTRNLGQARVVSRAVGGDALDRILPRGRGIDHVYRQLLLSHLREDWRFRMQAMILPMIMIIMVVAAFLGVELERFFADPFGTRQLYHPAMITVVAVMIPPILSLPFLGQSQDYKAAWLLRTGRFSPWDYARTVRKYIRLFFCLPMLSLMAVGYVLAGVGPLSIGAHLFFLFLMAETMSAYMQTQFGKLPFSMPPQDEETATTLIVIYLVFQTFALIIALTVYHVVYRWPLAYVTSAGMLAAMAYGFLHTSPKDAGEKLAHETPPTSSLILATKRGNYHTVKLLLEGGADPCELDATGKTAANWAEELEHERIAQLLSGSHPD